jgi:hypothetical protein
MAASASGAGVMPIGGGGKGVAVENMGKIPPFEFDEQPASKARRIIKFNQRIFFILFLSTLTNILAIQDRV